MTQNKILEIALSGGWLALDFINTVSDRKNADNFRDYLDSYSSLILWSKRLGLIPEEDEQLLYKIPGDKADHSLQYALKVREAVYRVFNNWIESRTISQENLNLFNGLLLDAYAYSEIGWDDKGVFRHFPRRDTHPDRTVWEVLLSAESLLLSDKLHRVKSCDACGWLFLDGSKNGTRRWCDMQVCGSQVKARKYYYRKKAGEGERGSEEKVRK